jgi:hypothetical protein
MASITITLKNDTGQVIGEHTHELGKNLSRSDGRKDRHIP